MKRWALLTAALYAVIIFLLVGVLFWELIDFVLDGLPMAAEIAGAYAAIISLCLICLLVGSVKLTGENPILGRDLLWVLLPTLLLMLLMGACMVLGLSEHLRSLKWRGESAAWVLVPIGAFWAIWAFLFGFRAAHREPKIALQRACRFLLVGSVLELLVAVPTHIVARQEHGLFDGIGTIWGVATGISVMLLAFGPAVFVLFARRCAPVKKPAATSPTPQDAAAEG